ncbi:BMA_0021/BMA_0022 family TOMM bacteriocin [Pseudoalteromonas rubra]|uniref:BMA_0021/BMA_0022 family TOMM bacteriocin n=1 Tax=Pseudoalteromonas rubra TaxID=43658 RepID=UPI002DB55E22|nr:BMA_0021/BMA_0022 family TOMM bacteriocin [Pseudoalteromonas rubra]MEC4090822.1 BMA_0021/BMA_0022 family TOMM bacteriocin [Pseudoalteromonas rubra]
MELTKQLLNFRATYLKAIAKAWNDEKFRKELCAPGNALSVLSKYFDYTCPWNIQFSIKDLGEGPFYNEARGVYMTDSLSFDKFVISIPKKPTIPNAVEALSQYYFDNSWILESATDDINKPNFSLQQVFDTLCVTGHTDKPESAFIFPSMKDGLIPEANYDLGNSNTHFVEFGGVMAAAVALAWSNSKFSKLFIDESISHRSTNTIGHTTKLLKEWLDYDYPWDVDLIVKNDELAKYVRTFDANITLRSGEQVYSTVAYLLDESNYKQMAKELTKSHEKLLFAFNEHISTKDIESISVSDSTIAIDKWVWCVERDGSYQQVQKTPLGIILSFPEAPDDKISQPIALTRYNNDGPGFPFTC